MVLIVPDVNVWVCFSLHANRITSITREKMIAVNGILHDIGCRQLNSFTAHPLQSAVCRSRVVGLSEIPTGTV